MHDLYRSSRRRRRGASTVEFAVVAPVFFLLVFGMIEFGRLLMVQQVLHHASREGARRAALEGASRAVVERVVRDCLSSGQITGDSLRVDVEPDPASAEEGTPVQVTVRVNFAEVSWLPTPIFVGARELTAATTMRRESAE